MRGENPGELMTGTAILERGSAAVQYAFEILDSRDDKIL